MPKNTRENITLTTSDLINFQRALLNAINKKTAEEKDAVIIGLKRHIGAIQQAAIVGEMLLEKNKNAKDDEILYGHIGQWNGGAQELCDSIQEDINLLQKIGVQNIRAFVSPHFFDKDYTPGILLFGKRI